MHTQYTIFIIKKKITPDYSKYAAMGFFQGTQERVRNSRDKRAISVRATQVLLYEAKLNALCNLKSEQAVFLPVSILWNARQVYAVCQRTSILSTKLLCRFIIFELILN